MNNQILKTVIKLLETTLTGKGEIKTITEAKRADAIVEACIEILKTINTINNYKIDKLHHAVNPVSSLLPEEEEEVIEFPVPFPSEILNDISIRK